MSLIDEALKRAQAASQQEGAKDGRPWTPAPLPDAGLAQRAAVLRAVLWTLGGIAALAILAYAGRAIWDAATPEAPPPTRVAAQAAQAVPTAEPTLPETIVPSPLGERPSAAAAAPAPKPAGPATESRKPGEASPQPASPPAPSGLADGRTYIAVVNLPEGGKIELGGIVWSEEEPRALLNDRIVAVGGYVEGFNVSKIDENRVVLTRDGMTIFLAVR